MEQQRVLAGGQAPRYIIGSFSEGARLDVGTTNIDLMIGLAVEDEIPKRIGRWRTT